MKAPDRSSFYRCLDMNKSGTNVKLKSEKLGRIWHLVPCLPFLKPSWNSHVPEVQQICPILQNAGILLLWRKTEMQIFQLEKVVWLLVINAFIECNEFNIC